MHKHTSVEHLADTPWPEGGLEPVARCPVCNSVRRVLLHEGLSDRVFFCAPGHWTMFRCTHCRSGYLDPRPSAETLGLAYTKYYTHADNKDQTVHSAALPQFAGEFRQSLRNGYENYRYGTKYSPASRLGRLASYLWPRMRRFIDQRHYYITNRPLSVLDVGFGDGGFLEQARKNGWNPVGVDIDPITVDQAREKDFEVYEGDVDVIADKVECFDAATLSHVIEHVPDPVKVLRTVFSVLKPGGMIYIDTPNLDAGCHKVFGVYWRGLEPPRHLLLFTWDSLEQLIREVGFVRLRRHRRPEKTLRLWRASMYVKLGVPYYSLDLGITVPWWHRLMPYVRTSKQEFLTLTAKRP